MLAERVKKGPTIEWPIEDAETIFDMFIILFYPEAWSVCCMHKKINEMCQCWREWLLVKTPNINIFKWHAWANAFQKPTTNRTKSLIFTNKIASLFYVCSTRCSMYSFTENDNISEQNTNKNIRAICLHMEYSKRQEFVFQIIIIIIINTNSIWSKFAYGIWNMNNVQV